MGDFSSIAIVFLAVLLLLVLFTLFRTLFSANETDPLAYRDADELAEALLRRGPDSSLPLDASPVDEEEFDDVADEDALPFGEERHFNAITGQVEGPRFDDPGEQLDDDELETFDTLHGYDPDYFDEGDDYQPDLGIEDDSDPGGRDYRGRR